MESMALALILGWCLVAAGREQHLPRPSLSLLPSQGVSVGDTVTLQCHLPQLAARVMLYQNRCWRTEKENEKRQTTVEFSFLYTKWTDMGVYWCQYQVLDPPKTSEQSNPVELVATDHMYPPPGISLSPEEHVEMGTNVTIQCWNQGYHGTFFLHKDGAIAHHAKTNGRSWTEWEGGNLGGIYRGCIRHL
ncbi:leukocyte immunoglobulin-like receptor subfamily A member 2 [Numida meleagris]|uniref:leukocyte immunoglobulin-like receptor subfamily A member 2 n=1 Tax=Numida meleagris TaxID=8996 RepID=UPI000B3DCE18|nr:leukocyte immunoglobulin-like receptor subfamily A member 2 [Numida meleagris]